MAWGPQAILGHSRIGQLALWGNGHYRHQGRTPRHAHDTRHSYITAIPAAFVSHQPEPIASKSWGF